MYDTKNLYKCICTFKDLTFVEFCVCYTYMRYLISMVAVQGCTLYHFLFCLSHLWIPGSSMVSNRMFRERSLLCIPWYILALCSAQNILACIPSLDRGAIDWNFHHGKDIFDEIDSSPSQQDRFWPQNEDNFYIILCNLV